MGSEEEMTMTIGGNEEKIYVSVRLRPMNGREILRNDVSDWDCINEQTIVYKNVSLSVSERSMYPTAYTFDRVFRSDCSTREVYEQGAKEVATSVVRGMNASIFAYGQTSSGKTYTMTGITEYALADIFAYIGTHPERDFVLKFSAMEIYNESVRDLLSEDITPLRLLDDPERGTVVEKLSEEILRDWNHVIHLLSICDAQRQIGETSLNEMSSRSHQIIRLTTESSSREFIGQGSASTLSATVNFVDLAGSERASQSLSAGTRLKEGCHINRSLLTLGTVIRKLSKGRNGHIPYRDSKLTRILQTSLGGNARTAIICTMSPARSHVEQSRNTLLFASCAKEVTTSAQVNVVMSDKALVKYLQREISRLESEMRISQSTDVPSNYTTILREKDLQMEKLERQINDLILERDNARSQVKDMLQILGDDASCLMQEQREEYYPQLRVQRLMDRQTMKQETLIEANPLPMYIDPITHNGHSGADAHDHTNCIRSSASSGTSINTSNSNDVYSYNGWEWNEKQSNWTMEDPCKEVHCIETEDLDSEGAKESESFSTTGFPDGRTTVPSIPSGSGQEFKSFPFKRDNEMNESLGSWAVPVMEDPVLVSASFLKDESLPKEEKEFSSMHLFDASSLENQSSTHRPDKDSSVSRSFKLSRSRSCKARIADSSSPWFKMMYYSENTLSMGFDRNPSPFTCSFNLPSSSRKDTLSSRENAFDIEMDTPNLKLAAADDVISSTTGLRKRTELPIRQMEVIEPKVKEASKTNMEDVGLDPIEDESKGLLSWTLEFERLQREIIELWNACNVSLVYRTNFFMLFQGEPSDVVYLEVELRRMKFLKDKVSHGDKIIVNGRSITLASSMKALHKERKMLSKRMSRKLSEQERENLFFKWGIGINTKLRRRQLAHCLWTKTEDMDHIFESASLVWKLVGFLEQGQTPTKEIGLNFTPERSTRTHSIRRSLQFLS